MKNPLAELRVQIDAIDDEILSLLEKRSKVVYKVGEYKEKQPVKVRPAREIQMNWNLAQKSIPAYPAPVLQRIWREIITSTLTIEGDFAVDVFFDEKNDLRTSLALWDLTRDHFGSWCPIYRSTDKIAMIEQLAKHEVELVVMPIKNISIDPEPWWLYLANRPKEAEWYPRIAFHLPFSGPSNSWAYHDIEALVLSCATIEPSGHDETLFCIEVLKGDYGSFLQKIAMQDCVLIEKADPDKHKFSAALVKFDGYLVDNETIIAEFLSAFSDYEFKVTLLGTIGKTPEYI
ncbi:MAG: chorismate mutase [Alphaproteobacteria bacterium]